MSDSAAIKAEANKAFAAKDYPLAIKLYSDGIAIDPTNHVLFSNRAAAKSGARDYQGALEDAEKCIEIAPTFAKGFARKGAALHGLRSYPEAVMAYEAGLQVDEGDAACKKGLAEVKSAMEASSENPFGPGGDMGMGKIFNDPALIPRLQAHPKTMSWMRDPAFVQKVRDMGKGGSDMGSMLSDPRMLTVMGVAMGIDIDAMERPEGSNEMPPGTKPMPTETPSAPTPASTSASSSKPTPAPAPAAAAAKSAPAETPAPASAASEDVDMDDSDVSAKKEADELKAKGTVAYKARKFDEAAEAYQKAWDTYPKDVTYLTNLSAVYFEQGEYAKCIETCEKAVEEGRELRVDYKIYAKAYARIGSAYQKQNDLTNAIKFYGKSLTEHRTPDVLTKLREAEKAKAAADREAYVDPAKAEAARAEGNDLFKKGDFAGAVKSYTEAIKRQPTDPRAYNNRATCYTKLMAFPEALKDADEAIKVDPAFIKAYIRKALVQQGMKEHAKALETLQKATEKDVEKKARIHQQGQGEGMKEYKGELTQQHTRELEDNMQKVMYEMNAERAGETDEQAYARAMRDPEVQEIMADPLMRQILQDSQQDPRALVDHMKNPMIAQKIQKLINAGIIRTR